MASWLSGYLDRLSDRRSSKRWSKAAQDAQSLPLAEVKPLRSQARTLRRNLDHVIYHADHRLAAQMFEADPIYRHPSTDWVWRPDLWRGPVEPHGAARVDTGDCFGYDVKIFHDARQSSLGLRQLRNVRAEDYAPFALQLETFDFDGSFFSVVFDLPEKAAETISLKHVLRLDLALETEAPVELITRVNVKHGPNTDQILREITLSAQGAPKGAMTEFDLAYAKINEKRIEKIWVDLIFGNVEMNKIILRDVSLSRRLRSEL